MEHTLAVRVMKAAIEQNLTSREQLVEMRERIYDRFSNRKREIKDLHEMIANYQCEAYGITNEEALSIIAMLQSFCDMDEDRIEVISDLLGR